MITHYPPDYRCPMCGHPMATVETRTEEPTRYRHHDNALVCVRERPYHCPGCGRGSGEAHVSGCSHDRPPDWVGDRYG